MRLLACVVLCLALPAVPAYGQGDPIMPLEQVERGMVCEGRSVFRGTEIETFGVEILDVIEPNGGTPAGILFRASGPLVAETGLGFGFSGSPIYCPGSDGIARVAGAVALSVEDYGNDVALATPIEDMLDMPLTVPAGARPATRAESNAKPLGSPLMLAGVGSARVRHALATAAGRNDIRLLTAPASSAQVTTGTDLQPGSAVAAGLSSGDIGLSAIGTVTYRDGTRIWGFGHPFEGVGQRSLLLQGAFVHTIVGNPNPPGFDGLGTYKLASAGDVAGLMDFDGNFAISGLLGAPPTVIPLDVKAKDAEGNAIPTSNSLVADESGLDHPNGFPSLSFIASIAVSDQALLVVRSSAGAVYGRMCTRIELAEREDPLRFCNRYVGDPGLPGGSQFAMSDDAMAAATLVETYDRELLDVERMRVSLTLTPGNRFAELRRALGPRSARPGQRIRVRLRVQQPREPAETVSFRMRVPESVKPGMRTLRLNGASADGGEGSFEDIFSFGFGEFDEFGGGNNEPTTIEQLADRVADIHRYDGVRATFRRPADNEEAELDELLGIESSDSAGKPVFRDPEMRIGGSAKIRIRIRG